MDAFAEQLLEFTIVIIEIDGQRKEPRHWFPGRIAKVKDNLTSDEFKGSAGLLSMGTMDDPTTFMTRSEASSSQSTVVNPVRIENGAEGAKRFVIVKKRNSCIDCQQ